MAGCEKEGTDRHISKIKPKWVKPLLPSSPWMRTGSVRQRSSWRTCSNIECAAPCCNFQRCQKTARARFVFSKSLWGKTTGSLPDSCKARTKSLGKMIGWLSAFPTLTRRMRTGARIAASSKAATATSACKIVFLRDFHATWWEKQINATMAPHAVPRREPSESKHCPSAARPVCGHLPAPL